MGAPGSLHETLGGGRLAYGCTNLALAWPHGGTGLGLVGEVYVIGQREWEPLPAEETGSAAAVQWLGGDVVMGFTHIGWDDNALAFLFPNTGTAAGHTIVEWPGSDVPVGAPLTTYTNVVFTPHKTTHPGVVIYLACPVPDKNFELALDAYRASHPDLITNGTPLEVAGVVIALPDATDRLGKMGLFAGLVSGGL